MTVYIKNTPSDIDELPTILYNNLMATGTLSASSSATDYPVANIISEATTEYWKPTTIPAWVKVDKGSNTPIDCFAIIGHTLGSTNSVVRLQGSDDNSTWTLIQEIIPDDDSAIFGLFKSVSYRYYRIYVPSSTSVPFISVAMLGNRFTFPYGVMAPYTPTWACKTYQLLTATTVGGQFLGNRIQYTGGETKINLVAVETEFAMGDLEPFRDHYNKGFAFVWAMSPVNYNTDVAYVWRKESSTMSPSFDSDGNYMSIGMEVYVYGD